MTDLYRIDRERLDSMSDYQKHRVETALGTALHDEVLVPVEPCEHGNIDGHHPYYQTEKMDPTYCPGAGIGDSNYDERDDTMMTEQEKIAYFGGEC